MSLYNSTLAVRCADGLWRVIYVHSGGNDLRETLLEHWQSQDLAEKLISGGNASYVGETFADTEFYGEQAREGATIIHLLPFTGVSTDLPPIINQDVYVFENGTWFMFDPFEGDVGVIATLAAYEAGEVYTNGDEGSLDQEVAQ